MRRAFDMARLARSPRCGDGYGDRRLSIARNLQKISKLIAHLCEQSSDGIELDSLSIENTTCGPAVTWGIG
jgi:hypothetical protein